MDEGGHARGSVIRNGAERRLVARDGAKRYRHAAIKLRGCREGGAERAAIRAARGQGKRGSRHRRSGERFLHCRALQQTAPFGRRAGRARTAQWHHQPQARAQAADNGGRAVQTACHFRVRHCGLVELDLAIRPNPIHIRGRASNGINARGGFNFDRDSRFAQRNQVRTHA